MKDGLEPPAIPLFDYNCPLTATNERIPCKKCGKDHGNGLTDLRIYTHSFIDLSSECFNIDCFISRPITKKVVFSETETT